MFKRETTTKDGRPLIIRAATPEDARAVLAHNEAVSSQSDFLTFGAGEFGVTEEQEIEILERSQKTVGQIYLVALLAGEIIGTLQFSAATRARRQHVGEFGMAVGEQHWGIGVGGALLDALIAWARGSGRITKIGLRVRTDNQRALKLYESRGFRHEGTVTRDMRIGGAYFDNHCMGLEL